MRTSLMFTLLFTIAFTTSAVAVSVAVVEQLECGVTEPVCILVVPDASGFTMSEARTIAGEVVDASIHVRIVEVDEHGPQGPVLGFPAADLDLRTLDNQVLSCVVDGVMIADQESGLDGWTAFTLAPTAGGWSNASVQVYISGSPAAYLTVFPPLPIYFNSPDINGDLIVDLSDVALFTQDLGTGGAAFRSDLVWDGVINLSDIAVFTQHLGASCP
jgi:hypothetical protein